LVDGKKVDEDAALTIQALLDMGYTGRENRFWLLSVNYRKPVLFSEKRLDGVRKTLQRLDACIRALKCLRKGSECRNWINFVTISKTGLRPPWMMI
jgi:cysteinyl-tRNA synthetase